MTSKLGGQPLLPLHDKSGNTTPAWAGWFSTSHQILQAVSSSGSTAARPTANLYIGQPWFDVSLGLPVYVKAIGPPAAWVKADGSSA